ncbi:hypothetical protein XA68_13968 [Ophiocordyceps unilateralis]|uniref:Uncharacterized protein n=1 Tax=Ophiocordyceps unilateralis TaxID=268505 RepID=A0A2A9PMC4_OPHUN|nr:hypothetical protein XA68_13968 [Ophiocordyceps unilateralis]
MTRRLPWKANEEDGEIPSDASSRTKPQRPRLSPRRSEALDGGRRHVVRSPSTSPPPEPPQQNQFMRSADYGYRMVEDELLRTAQLFTVHLHRAEYERLKAQAKAQHAATIREIERPVVGDMSTSARLRAAVFSRAARHRAVLTPSPPSPESVEPVATGLRRLMDSPRAETRFISSTCPPLHSTTRAAAGFHRPSVNAHGSRRDAPSPPSTASPSAAEISPSRPHLTARRAPSMLSATAPRSQLAARSLPSTAQPDPPVANKRARRAVEAVANEPDDARNHDDGVGRASVSSEQDVSDDDPFNIKRRRIQRHKSRDKLRKHRDEKPLPDTIPSFL